MARPFFLFAVIVCLSIISTTAPAEATKLSLVKQYVDIIHVEEYFKKLIKMDTPLEVFEQQVDPALILESDGGKIGTLRVKLLDTNPGKIKEIDKAIFEAYANFERRILPIMLERAYPFFANTYSEDELKTLISYSSNPIVQKGLIRGIEQDKLPGVAVSTPDEQQQIDTFEETDSRQDPRHKEKLVIKSQLAAFNFVSFLSIVIMKDNLLLFHFQTPELLYALKKYNLNMPDPSKTDVTYVEGIGKTYIRLEKK
ncbi:MAG: hypothetical protein RBT70_01820 [Alphaproteobacteria bacterium]|nr:hypothetical protein [Alphaproteobacteria bacterium]